MIKSCLPLGDRHCPFFFLFSFFLSFFFFKLVFLSPLQLLPLKRKLTPKHIKICLCRNISDVFTDSGATFSAGAVFLLFLGEVSGCV